MSPSKTEQLLERYQTGDRHALNQILELYRPFLCRVVQLRMDIGIRARLDSSDVVQEAQLEAVRRVDEYLQRRPMSFRVWLRETACQRLAILRRHHTAARRSVVREIPLPEESSLVLARQLLAGGPSAHLRREEAAAQVREAVARLPEGDREILLMRNFEELTNAEAAEILGIDPTTASKRYGRALIRLRNELRRIRHDSELS